MLANWIVEPTGMAYLGGISHDALLAPLRQRIARAKIFCLSPEAVAMAANVSMSKPSSIVAALPWVRLPAPLTWIEFANLDVRQAMADLGSPNLPPPNVQVQVLRTGFLMQEKDGRLVMDYVHTDRTKDGQTLNDLAPVQVYFDLDPERPTLETALAPVRASGDLKGRVRQHFNLISNDPSEARAEAELRQRFSWIPHPEMAAAAQALERVKGADFVRQAHENQAMDAWRMFAGQILPGLILLNCRNAVSVENVEPSAKLNRNREAKGRAPLRAHGLVKMTLRASQQRAAARQGRHRQAAYTPLVIGHFKTRKSGVFWWSPHVRTGHGDPRPLRQTVLVP